MPDVTARLGENGRTTVATISGYGDGGHKGTLRALGNHGADHLVAIQWDGDTYTTVLDGTGYDEIIVKADLKSERHCFVDRKCK